MNLLTISILCVAAVTQSGNQTETSESYQPVALATACRLSLYPNESNAASVSFAGFDDDTAPPFGAAGSWRWHVGVGGAVDVKSSDNRLVQAGVGLSYFIVDDLSLDAEVNAIYFNQVGDDAVGANLNLSFRYHLIARDTWSLYGDAGAGILGTTERVPTDGSSFNFVPHAGVGMSFDVGSNVRLFTGVRWHHISNASTYRNNPGRDSVLGYVQLSFPF